MLKLMKAIQLADATEEAAANAGMHTLCVSHRRRVPIVRELAMRLQDSQSMGHHRDHP